MMREVVENFANHPEYTDKINFHFLPVANPDGYEYSWTDVSALDVKRDSQGILRTRVIAHYRQSRFITIT